MAETPSKLFHAIVGLGLIAAGCGEVETEGGVDAGGVRHDAAPGPTTDAVAIQPAEASIADAAADVGLLFDAATTPDAGTDAADGADVDADAAWARDAAMDVTQPPPPEIK